VYKKNDRNRDIMSDIIPSEATVDIVMKMSVPLEYKYDKDASIRWRILKAIELDRQQMYQILTQKLINNEKVHYDRRCS
jgi:hypothetical protein